MFVSVHINIFRVLLYFINIFPHRFQPVPINIFQKPLFTGLFLKSQSTVFLLPSAPRVPGPDDVSRQFRKSGLVPRADASDFPRERICRRGARRRWRLKRRYVADGKLSTVQVYRVIYDTGKGKIYTNHEVPLSFC